MRFNLVKLVKVSFIISGIAGALFIVIHAYFGVGALELRRYFWAQIEVVASIPSNPFNILAEQLKEKESKLSLKESELQQKETLLEERAQGEQNFQDRIFTYGAIAGGMVLLMLILLNFYFDKRRQRHPRL